MATQKKGCGFLITALILLIIGGIVAFLGIKGAVDSAKDFTSITEFQTPDGGDVTATEDGAISVWMVGGNDTTRPSGLSINAKDLDTGEYVTATIPSSTSRINDRMLLGSFPAEKGKKYKVHVTGVSNDRTISISSISPDAALGVVGKGLGGVFGAAFCGFLALIFGIIGLVKFFSSKKAAPPAA